MKLRKQFMYGLRGGTTVVQGSIEIDQPAGAVGTVDMPGVTSVVRAGTGKLTINLDEKYLGLVGFQAQVEAGSTCADGYSVQLVDSQYVDGVAGTNDGNGYLQIETINTSHAVADALNAKIWVTLHLKTSAAG